MHTINYLKNTKLVGGVLDPTVVYDGRVVKPLVPNQDGLEATFNGIFLKS